MNIETLKIQWPNVIEACRRQNRDTAALLYTAQPVSVLKNGLITLVELEAPFPYMRDKMRDDQVNKLAIQHALGQVIGTPVAMDVRCKGEESKMAGYAKRNAKMRKPSSRFTGGGVRSIQTQYGEFLMRSKLEASTAKLMDSVAIEWDYEAEGYDIDGVWYLPDFFLAKNRMFLEVKGVLDNKSEEKVIRLAGACIGSGIRVMLLFSTRPRQITGQRALYVGGSLVNPDGIIPDSVVLARCPRCEKAAWKLIRSATCPLCGRQADSPHDFLPA